MRLLILFLEMAGELAEAFCHRLNTRAGHSRHRKRGEMNWWEEMAMTVFVGVLRGAVKNPAKLAGVSAILQEMRDDLCTIVSSINPAAPPPPGYKAD
jgi:hypothetical protein